METFLAKIDKSISDFLSRVNVFSGICFCFLTGMTRSLDIFIGVALDRGYAVMQGERIWPWM
jgi:hypothetical protein